MISSQCATYMTYMTYKTYKTHKTHTTHKSYQQKTYQHINIGQQLAISRQQIHLSIHYSLFTNHYSLTNPLTH